MEQDQAVETIRTIVPFVNGFITLFLFALFGCKVIITRHFPDRKMAKDQALKTLWAAFKFRCTPGSKEKFGKNFVRFNWVLIFALWALILTLIFIAAISALQVR